MPSRIPTSTAYWNLRAEQVLDRVFHEAEPSLKAVEIRVDPVPDPVVNSLPSTQKSTPAWQQLTLIGITLGAVLSSAWIARNWHLTQQTLHHERHLALMEKLKTRTIPSPQPPPPEEVKTLPNLVPLTLPLSTAMAPATHPSSSPHALASDSSSTDSSVDAASADKAPKPANHPLLVGVVQAEGGGSAIFQVENQSLSASPGDSIGNSGWSLLSISSTGAVIERNGQRHSLAVGGAF